jgi:hypothetical protein
MLPMMLLLMMNAINFGLYLYEWITLSNALRGAALYQVYNGVVLGSNGGPPAFGAVQNALTADGISLRNAGSIAVQVCSSKNGTNTCAPAMAFAPVADSDPTRYTSWSVDVTYTYQPLFPALTLPVVNVPLTIPTGVIHRQTVMRSMQ